jgi:hypothetical protein
MTDVDMLSVTPAAHMMGEDEEETDQLHALLHEATEYMQSFRWCHGIAESYFGLGIGGILAVFLFRIDSPPPVDEWLWAVVGDIPPCYLVTEAAPTPLAALQTYCDVMQDWVTAVRNKWPLDELAPVNAEPTERNAAALDSRIAFVRTQIIPLFSSPA